MNKFKLFGTLSIFGALAITLVATMFSVNSKAKEERVSWLDNYPDYEDYIDNPYDNKDEDTRLVKSYTFFTDEECVSSSTGYKGRVVKVEKWYLDDVGFKDEKKTEYYEEYCPPLIQRNTNRGYYKGQERNPNEWCQQLQFFLDDYIKSPTGSYDSFCNYIDYLVNDFGMYEDEAEAFRYRWRYAHGALTDEDKAAIKAEEDELQKRKEEAEKATDEYLKDYFDAMNQNNKNKLSLYEREAKMIESTTPDYYHFDRDKFISLREKGIGYLDAYNQSISINYSEGVDYITGKMDENKSWYEKTYKDLTSDDMMTSLENFTNHFTEMFKELFGDLMDSSDSSNTEGESE